MPKKIQQKNLAKLTRLFAALDEDSLTRKEFTENFGKILQFLKNLKQQNKEEFASFNKTLSDLSDKLKEDNTTNLSGLKNQFVSLITKALKDQEDGMNFIRDKVRSIKNGVDGRDGIDGKDGADGKDGMDGKADDSIIKKLKKQLDVFKKKLNELDKRKVIYTGSGGAELGGHIRYYDLSSELDGSTKTFSLPAFARVVDVKLSSIPVLRLTTDYTINGSTFEITFTSEVKASTNLASGQSCWILYATQ